MTTDPTNHRDEAGLQLAVARDDSESDPIGLGILHGILALHDLIAGLSDDDLVGEGPHFKPAASHDPRCAATGDYRAECTCPGNDPWASEEQHQSEKFETTPLWFPGLVPGQPGPNLDTADYEVELDEDNPDTLVGDTGLVDDADTIARPLSSGGRVDFWDAPYPFGAA